MKSPNLPSPCFRAAALAAGILALLLGQSAPLLADTIDYKFPDATVTSSYTRDGVTVTGGPGSVYVNLSNGLSIIGGGNDYDVGAGEFLSFNFDFGSASDVSFHINGGPTATADILAFGLGGAFLGLQSVTMDYLTANTVDVSALYGGQQITHFSVGTTAGAYRLDLLNFTAAAAVPDTANTLSLLLLGSASLGLVRIVRTRRNT